MNGISFNMHLKKIQSILQVSIFMSARFQIESCPRESNELHAMLILFTSKTLPYIQAGRLSV